MSNCTDWRGHAVTEGHTYSPTASDMCMVCMCFRGASSQCRTASCAFPPCHNFKVVPGVCCEFRCLNDEGNSDHDTKNATVFFTNDTLTTAGVRLVASTLTCVMVLLLIVFFMHKLRRHRRFLMNVPDAFRRRRHDLGRRTATPNGEGCQFTGPTTMGVTYRHLDDEPPPPYVSRAMHTPFVFASSEGRGYIPPPYPDMSLSYSCCSGNPAAAATPSWKIMGSACCNHAAVRCNDCAPLYVETGCEDMTKELSANAANAGMSAAIANVPALMAMPSHSCQHHNGRSVAGESVARADVPMDTLLRGRTEEERTAARSCGPCAPPSPAGDDYGINDAAVLILSVQGELSPNTDRREDNASNNNSIQSDTQLLLREDSNDCTS